MVESILSILQSYGPLGLALCVIFLLVGKNSPAKSSQDPLCSLAEPLQRIENLLSDISKDLSYIKGRINGRME